MAARASRRGLCLADHFEYFEELLASIKRALKPSGRLVLVDFEREEGKSTPWVMGHVRCGRAQVFKEVEAAGFKRVSGDPNLDGKLKENWLAVWVKA